MSEIDKAYRLAWKVVQQQIAAKTGWGRTEIMTLMNDALNKALEDVAEGEKDG